MENGTPFDATAAGYDDEFTRGCIGTVARARFWRRVGPFIPAGADVLELGGGTGEDACHFAMQGARVTYTDASAAMVAAARAKVSARGLAGQISCSQLDMSRLHEADYRHEVLGARQFDVAYANFGAINCVTDLPAVAEGLAQVLRPGAPMFLTVMGPLVPWEWGWYVARGQFGTAFRRLRRGGVVWRGMRIVYPTVRALERAFAAYFSLQAVGVVNAFVPPSYCESVFASRPGWIARLDRLDERFADSACLARFADHYLAHFVRK